MGKEEGEGGYGEGKEMEGSEGNGEGEKVGGGEGEKDVATDKGKPVALSWPKCVTGYQ